MRERLSIEGPTFLSQVREVVESDRLDDTFVDALCEPAEVFTYGGMIAHVLTFAAHRRTLVVLALSPGTASRSSAGATRCAGWPRAPPEEGPGVARCGCIGATRHQPGGTMSQPVVAASENALMLSYLAAQRRHVLGILEGLDEQALRLPVLPSGWTCLGLVQHLTLDVERFWFRAVVAGDEEAAAGLLGLGDESWTVGPDVPAAAGAGRLSPGGETLTDAIVGGTALDAAPAWWPTELFGDWRMDDLREVLLHVLVETAAHAGHLDAARELLDGRQWMVLTG